MIASARRSSVRRVSSLPCSRRAGFGSLRPIASGVYLVGGQLVQALQVDHKFRGPVGGGVATAVGEQFVDGHHRGFHCPPDLCSTPGRERPCC